MAAFALKGGLAEPGDTTWVNRAEDVELENGGEAFLIDKDTDPEVGPVTAAGVMLRAVCEGGYPQGFNRPVE